MAEYKLCMVIPHYNHFEEINKFLPRLVSRQLPIIVVDDGSNEKNKQALKSLLQNHNQCELVEHQANQGKGGAMKSGANAATEMGFTHVLQIDADGQHNTDDIEKFISYSKEYPLRVVSGAPVFADDAPKARVYGRKVTNFWVALETFSLSFRDSLCGFRIYPLEEFNRVVENHTLGNRMDFDTEILVKAVWEKVQIHFIETKVIYHQNAVSHFNYLQDNMGLIWLHIRLMFGMIFRSPKLLFWRLNGFRASV